MGIAEWLFQGLGTTLIGLVIGSIAGGAAGFRMGVRSKKQNQKAGDQSTQIQVGRDFKNPQE